MANFYWTGQTFNPFDPNAWYTTAAGTTYGGPPGPSDTGYFGWDGYTSGSLGATFETNYLLRNGTTGITSTSFIGITGSGGVANCSSPFMGSATFTGAVSGPITVTLSGGISVGGAVSVNGGASLTPLDSGVTWSCTDIGVDATSSLTILFGGYTSGGFTFAGTVSLSDILTTDGPSTVTGTLTLGTDGRISNPSNALEIGAAIIKSDGASARTVTQNSATLTGNPTFGAVGALGALTFSALTPSETFDLGSSSRTLNCIAPVSIASVVTGSGALVKTGTNTLTLTGANTNSGGVTISQGTVKTGSATSLGTGAVSVAAGTTLQLGSAASGKATLGGTLTINGGTLRIGG